VPDAERLDALAAELGEAVIDHEHALGKARLDIRPESVADVLEHLRERGYRHLMSVHGLDYYPHEPRLGVQYELLDRDALDRLTIRLRVPLDAPNVPSVTPAWPTADHQEREIYDLLGVVFDGHPDLRRILMPDDYIGHPQRRDVPIGGEPILFTFNSEPGITGATR
jgi:NADH-quinone oxidoreductase subunit C